MGGGSVRNALGGGGQRAELDGKNQNLKQNAILRMKGGLKSAANAEATYGIQRRGQTRNHTPLLENTPNWAPDGFLWDRHRILPKSTTAKFRGQSELG